MICFSNIFLHPCIWSYVFTCLLPRLCCFRSCRSRTSGRSSWRTAFAGSRGSFGFGWSSCSGEQRGWGTTARGPPCPRRGRTRTEVKRRIKLLLFFYFLPWYWYQLSSINGFDLCCVTEDVEVDVESIVFDCMDSDGLSIAHMDADHSYSSLDRSWLWPPWPKVCQVYGGNLASFCKASKEYIF